MDRLILDTNVVLSALKSKQGASHKLLWMAGTDKYDLILSNTLIIEYESVLKRHYPTAEIDDLLDYLCSTGIEVGLFYLWRPQLKDPKDDFILELAVASHARIITYSIKDFKQIQGFDILVQTPKEYMKERSWVQ